MILNKMQKLGLALLSGLLLMLSFPETGGQTYLSFIAFIPLLLIEQSVFEQRHRSRKVFVYAYLSFFVFNIGTTWWIWNASEGGAIMAFVFNSLLMSIFFQFYHWIKKWLGFKVGMFAFLVSWISFEYFHFSWELSWPWLNLGNVFASQISWIQWYEFTGILGGTLWILLLNVLLFQLLLIFIKRKKTSVIHLSIAFTLLLLPILLSSLIQTNIPSKISKKVLVLQPNIDPYGEKFTVPVSEQVDRLIGLVPKHKKFDYIFAPETAITLNILEDQFALEPSCKKIIELSEQTNSNILIGASTVSIFKNKNSRASRKLEGGPGFIEFYNTAVQIEPSQKPSFSHKSKLVLGVEKLPFSDIFPFIEQLSIDNGGTSGTLGIEKEPKVLGSKVQIAPVICYESIYGDFVRSQCAKGASLIGVITNDGWWGDTPGYKQHL
jgi:apolipoprotein N-acyltransferase